MTTQQNKKHTELPDTQQAIPFFQRISTISGIFFCILMACIFSGTWYVYHLSRQALHEEIQQRGIWIARNVIANIRNALLHEDDNRIRMIIDHLELEKDISYLVLFDQASVQVFSQAYDQKNSSLPAAFRPLACESAEPEISMYTAGNERFYQIGLRIMPPPDLLHTRETGEAVSQSQHSALSQNADCIGTIHLGLSLDAAEKILHPLLVSIGILTAGSFLLGSLGLFLISRKIVAPLGRLSVLMNRMANGDVRQQIPRGSKTEIRWLEAGLSRLLSSSQTLGARLANAKEQITSFTEEILTLSEEHADFNQKQVTSIYQILQTLNKLAEASAQIAKQAATVTEGMASGLQTTLQAKNTAKETISSIEDIRKQVGSNTDRVVHLGEKVAQIDHVVKIITTIADQTKLIAFNASIEAAGAGEAGGRFSVVATEVRRLANTVVESVEEIKNSVSSIQTSTSELILSSETGIRKVNQGVGLIDTIEQTVQHIMTMLDNTSHLAQEISAALQEQQSDMNFITEHVNDISNTSEKTIEIAKRTNELAKELRDVAKFLDYARQESTR